MLRKASLIQLSHTYLTSCNVAVAPQGPHLHLLLKHQSGQTIYSEGFHTPLQLLTAEDGGLTSYFDMKYEAIEKKTNLRACLLHPVTRVALFYESRKEILFEGEQTNKLGSLRHFLFSISKYLRMLFQLTTNFIQIFYYYNTNNDK